MNIALLDYGAGNLSSVANALKQLELPVRIVDVPEGLEGASHVVLPGVGSFGDCMQQLSARGLVEPLRKWLRDGKPYLGICLGYQILFDSSEESPGISGLCHVAGKVIRFPEDVGEKVPHMGWNAADPEQPREGVWKGLGDRPYFYFVHSYFPKPVDDSVIAATTRHGSEEFAAAIQLPNVLACQFHPEKSQSAGLSLLRNFFAEGQ